MVSLGEISDEKVKYQSVPSDDIDRSEVLDNASDEPVEVKMSDPAVMVGGLCLIAAGCALILLQKS